ncbi:MAG: TonB-dependent receptor family protein [Gammaproteobacteria bacterium]
MYSCAEQKIFCAVLLLCLAGFGPEGFSAQTEVDGGKLEEITVTSTRVEQSLYTIPAAIGIVDKHDIQLGRQQLGLDESLNRIPGLFSQNRYNFTQDLRIAIRGFGARANFGIRGIKIFVDEIPSTLADGQSGVDDIDMGSAQRIEVIRGPSSSLYGAASGGVISLYTEDGPHAPFAETKFTLGEFDQQKYQFKTGGQYKQLNYLLNASYLTMDGFRDHSDVKHALINTKFRYDIDDSSNLTVVINAVDSPTADDPGAITAAQASANPEQAQARNLSSNAGEELDQQKLGLVYRNSLNDHHQITLRNYYLWKDFATFLPIGTHIPFVADDGVVEFSRFFFGGGAQDTYSSTLFGRPNRFTFGFDIDIQRDDRQRFLNNAGIKGSLSFDQLEEAESYGFYFRNETAILDTLRFTFGGRYDKVNLSVNDRFLANGDQSSDLDFDEFNPTIGLIWDVLPELHLYANYATSFETPTFTELANPARNLNVNLGGFNNVNAQSADSVEVGIKGTLNDRVHFDIAAFSMQVSDEIVSVTNVGNRAFFQNADTDRNGVEAMLVAKIMKGLKLSAAYTYSDFEFDKFPANTAVQGNDLPGLPDNQFYTELAYTHDSGLYLIWDILYVDKFFANNTNSVSNHSSTVANLRAGFSGRIGNWEISPYIGLNNMFDESYNSNVRLNGFGGRLFEPAPDRNVYGGLTIRYNLRNL